MHVKKNKKEKSCFKKLVWEFKLQRKAWKITTTTMKIKKKAFQHL